MNVTLVVAVATTLSVVSVAVKTGAPAVDDFTVNVTTPARVEAPEAADIVSVAPRSDASVTVLPETGLPVPSSNVTVMVAVLAPSATWVVGEAISVESSVSAGGIAVKLMLAGAVTVMPSVVSVAEKLAVPTVADFAVKVTTPEAFETPEAAEIVSLAPRSDVRVTVLPAMGLLFTSFSVTVMVEVVLPLAGTELCVVVPCAAALGAELLLYLA